MRRLLPLFPATVAFLLLLAPIALADPQEQVSGEGAYGVADDKVVTFTGFIVIGFFPLVILLLSLLQWRLEKRKDARKAAAKRLKGNGSGAWKTGW